MVASLFLEILPGYCPKNLLPRKCLVHKILLHFVAENLPVNKLNLFVD